MASTPLIAPAARRPRSGSAAEDRARGEQTADLSPIFGAALLKARKIGSFVLSTEALTIAHGQGRPLAGWLATRHTAPAHVVEVSADRDTLVLVASDDVRIDLWVW